MNIRIHEYFFRNSGMGFLNALVILNSGMDTNLMDVLSVNLIFDLIFQELDFVDQVRLNNVNLNIRSYTEIYSRRYRSGLAITARLLLYFIPDANVLQIAVNTIWMYKVDMFSGLDPNIVLFVKLISGRLQALNPDFLFQNHCEYIMVLASALSNVLDKRVLKFCETGDIIAWVLVNEQYDMFWKLFNFIDNSGWIWQKWLCIRVNRTRLNIREFYRALFDTLEPCSVKDLYRNADKTLKKALKILDWVPFNHHMFDDAYKTTRDSMLITMK